MSQEPVWQLGQRVQLVGKQVCGNIAFVGQTQFASGLWIGVVLDEQKGRNDGSVRGISYFKCATNCGIFVRATQLLPAQNTILKNTTNMITTTTFTTTTTTTTIATTISTTITSTSDIMENKFDTARATPTRTTTTKIARPQMSSCSSQLALNVNCLPGPMAGITLQRSKTSVSPTASFLAQKQASFVETGFLEIFHTQFTLGNAQRTTRKEIQQQPQQQQQQQQQQSTLVEPLEDDEIKNTIPIQTIDIDIETLVADNKRLQQTNEQMKLQNRQLVEFKLQILEQQQLMQRDLQRLHQELRDAHEEKCMLQRQNADLQDNLELVSLDKEVAEERVETIQLELELAQEKLEELTLEIEIFRAEQDDVQQSQITPSSHDMKQLQQRNQRLTETVLRLRDVLTQEKLLQQKTQKELQIKLTELADLQQNKQNLTQRISYMEEQLLELKEQVDAALGAEQMVLHLTSIKFELEDRLKLMEEEISELESLEQIHEQLLESSQELEQEMREEVSQLQIQLRQWQQQHNDNLQRLQERDQTISKFRQLVQHLQQQQQQQHQQQQQLDSLSSINSLVDSDSSLANYNQLFSLFKTQEREFELKLQHINCKSLQLHIKWLLAYVPDEFMLRGGTHDIILSIMCLQRLSDKLQLICQLLQNKLPAGCDFDRQALSEGFSVQRCLFRCHALFLLRTLQLSLQQLLSALQNSDYDLCTHAAIYRHDLESQEQHLDNWLQLLKTDMLDENTNTLGLEYALSFCNNLLFNLLATALPAIDDVAYMLQLSTICHTLLQIFEISIDGMFAAANLLLTILPLEPDTPHQVYQLLQNVRNQLEELRLPLRRLQRKSPPHEINLEAKVTRGALLQVQRCNLLIGQSLKLLTQVCKDAARQLFSHWRTTSPEQIQTELSLKPIDLWNLLERHQQLLNGSEFLVTELFPQTLNRLDLQLQQLGIWLQSAPKQNNNTCLLDTREHVLMQRAGQLKCCTEDMIVLRQRIDERDKEIRTLKYVAKMKQNDYSELQIRKEMAERNLIRLQQQQEKFIQQFQESMSILIEQQQERERDCQMALYRANARLDNLQMSWQHWRNSLLDRDQLQHMHERDAWQDVQSLNICLRRERQQFAKERAQQLKLKLQQLEEIKVPLGKVCPILKQLEEKLMKLRRKWLLTYLSLSTGVDLLEERRKIRQESNALMLDIMDYYYKRLPHRRANTNFGQFASRDWAPKLKEMLNS